MYARHTYLKLTLVELLKELYAAETAAGAHGYVKVEQKVYANDGRPNVQGDVILCLNKHAASPIRTIFDVTVVEASGKRGECDMKRPLTSGAASATKEVDKKAHYARVLQDEPGSKLVTLAFESNGRLGEEVVEWLDEMIESGRMKGHRARAFLTRCSHIMARQSGKVCDLVRLNASKVQAERGGPGGGREPMPCSGSRGGHPPPSD